MLSRPGRTPADVILAAVPPQLAGSSPPVASHGRRIDLVLGIVVGLVLGIAVVAAFVFLGSEGTIDAPRISGVNTGKPAPAAKPGATPKPRAARAAPAIPTVRIIGGAPPPAGPARLHFKLGERARIQIDTDAPVGIEIPGYGISQTIESDSVLSFEGGACRPVPDDRRRLPHRRRRALGHTLSFLPFAHALVARQDLPIPAWLFAWAASIVLIVSFFALSAAWRKPRFEEEHWRPFGGGLLPRPARAGRCRSSAGWSASSCSGSRSTPACTAPKRRTATSPSPSSSSPPGSASRSSRALLGDVFRPFNPWRAIGRVGGRRLPALIAGQRPAHLAYPEALGRWPAAIGLLGLRLAGGRLRLQRRRRGRPRPARGRRRRPRLQRLHAGDDGPVRRRGVVRAGRGLLGLLRDVLPARRLRGRGRPARPAPAALGRRPTGRRSPARPRW